ncbi:MAG TPA: sugar phosphate isomerase/epimerase, partial [Saprospiraceae bacterium]|nr:sugar phosphate isomerase/epimerase [Saprospiraceae bacterium]
MSKLKNVKGPAIFLAQFMGDQAPFNSLETVCRWAADLGYLGIQIPTWDGRLIDLEKAAGSKAYCDDLKGKVSAHGLEITELSTHLQGQLVAVHPAYNELFDGFAPDAVKGNPKARTDWAVQTLKHAAQASRNLGLKAHATFSGALIWHTVYPWPQRPKGLVDAAFKELASRWLPILNEFDTCGIDLCYEIHPGEDLHDGISFERFLAATGNHKRCNILYDPSHFVLQHLDYLEYIDLYHPYIKMFHVKDAELNPSGRSGVYGGYADWVDRAGRFRSLGDGQVDFKSIFSKLAQYGYEGWAVLEWECCIKDSGQGAKEGAPFIRDHIIRVTE